MSTNRQVATAWAAQGKKVRKAKNYWYDGVTLYSYSTPIAELVTTPIGDDVALVSRHSYSQSTHRHQSYASREADAAGIEVFWVSDVGLTTPEYYGYYLKRVAEYVGKAARARSRKECYIDQVRDYLATANRFNTRFGMGQVKLDEFRIEYVLVALSGLDESAVSARANELLKAESEEQARNETKVKLDDDEETALVGFVKESEANHAAFWKDHVVFVNVK